MNIKTVSVIGVAVLVGLFAFARFRANLTSVTPGALVTPAPTESEGEKSPQSNSGNVASGAKMTLTVTSPSNGASVTSSSVSIKGRTSPGAEIFVNESETNADSGGNFTITVSLDEGENYFVIVANDSLGNAAETELTVIYSPSQ